MECNFTFKHYEETLKFAKEQGYIFATFSEYNEAIKNQKVVFMRHDIDQSIRNALIFAGIEHKLGIKATYFVRVHAPYNPFNYGNYRILKEIITLGHEIGLHYTPEFSHLVQEDQIELFKRQRAYLESVINKKIKGVSSHEPANTKIQINDSNLKDFELEYQAYSDKFVKDIKYISDSSSRWREGCMCTFFKKGVPKLSILVHPIWWYHKTPLENY